LTRLIIADSLFDDNKVSFEGSMILLLFGPPGCGKGTQSVYLADRFAIPAISTGEMFRAECQAGTDLGRMVCSILKTGTFVGDDIVNQVVANRIARADCSNGFLLDGYPRTVPQAKAFDNLLMERGLTSPVVVQLDVADSELAQRLAARRQCPSCKRIFNVIWQPPRVTGVCDDDGTPLITREDDCEETIRQRLQVYKDQTDPILHYYGSGIVHRVDGAGSPEKVAQSIRQAVGQLASRV
jgi:adenylate kinase